MGCLACTCGPKGLSRPTYLATKKAVGAIERANEYRDDGALLYEPRFLDVERAVDELAASGGSRVADTAALVPRCSRSARDRAAQIFQSGRSRPTGPNHNVSQRFKRMRKTSLTIQPCDAILDR